MAVSGTMELGFVKGLGTNVCVRGRAGARESEVVEGACCAVGLVTGLACGAAMRSSVGGVVVAGDDGSLIDMDAVVEASIIDFSESGSMVGALLACVSTGTHSLYKYLGAIISHTCRD